MESGEENVGPNIDLGGLGAMEITSGNTQEGLSFRVALSVMDALGSHC